MQFVCSSITTGAEKSCLTTAAREQKREGLGERGRERERDRERETERDGGRYA